MKEFVKTLIKKLDHNSGGIPKTVINKNREVVMVIGREQALAIRIIDVQRVLEKIKEGEIDTLVITVKERNW